jgi:ATP-dependent Lhr-like helicase
LLARYGVVTRGGVLNENVPFGLLYPVFKGLEEGGRIRRGYFVAGLGATQFALPGALDMLRSLRQASEGPDVAVLAATDPANPFGAALKWPTGVRNPTRTVGATVVLVDGALAAFLARGDRHLTTFLPAAEPERSRFASAVASALIARARRGEETPRGMLIEEVDGAGPSTHPLLPYLLEAGFANGAMGVRATFTKD